MITCATVRQALFSVAKMGDPLMYTRAAPHRQRLRRDGVRAVLVLLRDESRPRYAVGASLIVGDGPDEPAADPVHDAPGHAADADAT